MNNSLRAQYLKAIGVQSWQLKSAPDIDFPSIVQEPSADQEPSANQEPSKDQESSTDQELNRQQKNTPLESILSETSKKISEHSISNLSEIDPELVHAIQSCQLCASRTKRLNALPGEGSARASVFIISEPPNAEEDRSGHYLTGPAQSLFRAMLNTIGLAAEYFLSGIIKCHSLEQFLVSEQEIRNCAVHLNAQLEQINPSVLMVYGAAQAQSVLQSKQSFNELRGKIHRVTINHRQYPLVVSYHPAFLLRNPLYKREALKDLIMLKNLLK